MEMDFVRVIYEVLEVDSFVGLIRVKDEKGERSDVRVSIEVNKGLLTEIKKGDMLEVVIKGWQVRSIRKINTESDPN